MSALRTCPPTRARTQDEQTRGARVECPELCAHRVAAAINIGIATGLLEPHPQKATPVAQALALRLLLPEITS